MSSHGLTRSNPVRTLVRILTLLLTATSATLVDNGTVITLDDIAYYAGGIPVSRIVSSDGLPHGLRQSLPSDLIPLTVLDVNFDSVGESGLNHTVARFEAEDDVFQKAFLSAVFLSHRGNGSSKPDGVACSEELRKHGTELLFTTADSNATDVVPAALTSDLPNGPYFVSARSGEVFKAYRLYPDDYLAFIQPTVSDGRGGHLSLTVITTNLIARSVAVPSRLYYLVTPEQPLAGLRLAVKDIYHVKGVPTSGGNRAYYYLYGTQNATAPSVQRLIDQGAVLVGKTGTVQFANGDRVTADWVDVHCPFNPRGDGYQDPSGSSTGSGAAIGAYEWLDLAVGSDTGGSTRGPAGAQGIYGKRPSTGAISMDHVIPLSPHLDTAGMLARSASLWANATLAWYTNVTRSFSSFPRHIYYSSTSAGYSDSGTSDNGALDLVDTFVERLQSFLGANRTAANITQAWIDTHPPQAPADISSMLYNTYGVLTAVDQFRLLGQPLFEDHAAQHEGRLPYINPGPLVRWQWGQNHSSSYAAAVRNMTLFHDWWSTYGYGSPSNESCSEGIYVYPWALGTPNYRDTYFDAPTEPPLGFGDWTVAGYAGAAELVVPVGEVPYDSRVSGQTEYLPVSASLMVASGCDRMLAELVKELEAAGILRASKTGSRI